MGTSRTATESSTARIPATTSTAPSTPPRSAGGTTPTVAAPSSSRTTARHKCVLVLRNRLKFALTKKEVQMICMQRLVKVDGKVRTDTNFPCGFGDGITLEKQGGSFRVMYDPKGRFVLQRLDNSS